MNNDIKNDSDEVKRAGAAYAGREPKVYFVIEVVDRDPASEEEAKTGVMPFRGRFRRHIDDAVSAANPALTQAAITLIHTASLMVQVLARDIQEATKGRLKKGQIIKAVYQQAQMLNEGHPDARIIAELEDKPKPRRREPEEPYDKKKGIVP